MGNHWDERFEGAEHFGNIDIPNVPDGTRILVISDQQIPFEDKELLDTVFNTFVPWYKPKNKDAEYHLFILGDLVDQFNLSSWMARVYPKFDLGMEMKWAREYLKAWAKRFTHKHFAMGNHEDRWGRYLYNNAPKLAHLMHTIEEELNLEELGYDWVPYGRHYDFVGFRMTHGNYAPKHAAARMLETEGTSGASGHVNRPQSYTYKFDKEAITWYTIGMTCRVDIGDVIKDWRKIQPWQQGFLIGEVRDGVLYVEQIRVHHGAFLASGKIWKVEEEK